MPQSERRIYLLRELLKEQPRYQDIRIPTNKQDRKNLLRSLFNIRMPAPVSDAFLKIQNEYLQEESARKWITDIADLTRTGQPVSVAERYYNDPLRGHRQCCHQPNAGVLLALSRLHRQCDSHLRRRSASGRLCSVHEEAAARRRNGKSKDHLGRSIFPTAMSCIPWARLFTVHCKKRTRNFWHPVIVPVYNLPIHRASGASPFLLYLNGRISLSPIIWRQKLP